MCVFYSENKLKSSLVQQAYSILASHSFRSSTEILLLSSIMLCLNLSLDLRMAEGLILVVLQKIATTLGGAALSFEI
ncbi:hypothetical protein ACJX0J_039563, partial [Zea mays]